MIAAPELGQLQLLDLSKVEIHASNPRKDVGDLTELAASIKSAGVLEPIVVVRKNGHYEAVTGSRRTAASRLAGMKQIPARVMEMDEAQVAAAALIENLQRKDLAPLEEAEAFSKYLTLTGATQKELGERVGKAPSTIANALRLLEAPKPVKAALTAGRIDAAHARELLKLADPGLAELALKNAGRFAAEDDQVDGEFSVVALKADGKITVRDIQVAVADVNEKYRHDKVIAGLKDALLAKKAELEAKGATVVWAENTYGDRDLAVATYLGKTKKAAVAGDYEMGEWKTHDKDCGCHSITLEVDRGEHEGRIKVAKACTNVAALRKWRARRYGGSGTNAQKAAVRKRIDPAKEDAKTVARYRKLWAEYDRKIAAGELRKVMGSGRLTPNVMRVIAMDHVNDDSPGLVSIIAKMTPPQLERFLIRAVIDKDTFKEAYRPKITAGDAWMIRTFGLDPRKLGYAAAVIEKCAYPLAVESKAKKAKR